MNARHAGSNAIQPPSDVGALVGQTNYIDYQALGYEGDPIENGGRFDKLGLEMVQARTVSEPKVE